MARKKISTTIYITAEQNERLKTLNEAKVYADVERVPWERKIGGKLGLRPQVAWPIL